MNFYVEINIDEILDYNIEADTKEEALIKAHELAMEDFNLKESKKRYYVTEIKKEY